MVNKLILLMNKDGTQIPEISAQCLVLLPFYLDVEYWQNILYISKNFVDNKLVQSRHYFIPNDILGPNSDSAKTTREKISVVSTVGGRRCR